MQPGGHDGHERAQLVHGLAEQPGIDVGLRDLVRNGVLRQLLGQGNERALLIGELPLVPEDAFLQLPAEVLSTEREAAGQLPSAAELIDAVVSHGAGTDLVGFYAGGPVARGFADSRGQRNWHRVESFHFEWCLYRSGDQAVKSAYAGNHWDEATFAAKVAAAREQVELLAHPRKALPPGEYRVYFSPVAVADLLYTLSWGGFGHKDVQTGVSTLIQAHRGESVFNPSVFLVEDTANGIAPRFQSDGFVKPDSVPLVVTGRVADTLVSPRSAKKSASVSRMVALLLSRCIRSPAARTWKKA